MTRAGEGGAGAWPRGLRAAARGVGSALAILLALGLPHAARAECRLALALGLDVSGSVDEGEYRLQLDGLADALLDEDVRAAMLAAPGFWISLAVYEWSSTSFQNPIADWTEITDAASLERLAARLRAHQRSPAPQATGLGAALGYGTALLDARADCWDRTLDISADGRNNDWPLPWRMREAGQLGDHRINALAVATSALGSRGTTEPTGAEDLKDYFEARIIHGADAFVELALGYRDYGRAMKRKLLREIATLPLGAVPQPRGDRREAALGAGPAGR